MKYHGITELVFFLHRTEIQTEQKEAQWKSGRININNIKDISRPPNFKELPQQIHIDRNVLYSEIETRTQDS